MLCVARVVCVASLRMVRTRIHHNRLGTRHIRCGNRVAVGVKIGTVRRQQPGEITILHLNRGGSASILTSGELNRCTGSDVQGIRLSTTYGYVWLRDVQDAVGLHLHTGAFGGGNLTLAFQGQLACGGNLYGAACHTGQGMPVCVDNHLGGRYHIRVKAHIRGQYIGVSVTQYRTAHSVYLVQQGDTGRQVHLLLFVLGQPVIQGINFTDLGLHLLAVVCRNAVGQFADQVLNGADLTGKGTRRTGVPRVIAAGGIMLVGAGQGPRDTAAVLGACMPTGNRLPRLWIALVCMLMNAVRLCSVAVLAVAMGTLPFQRRWNIPTRIGMRQMMRAQPTISPRVRCPCPHRA